MSVWYKACLNLAVLVRHTDNRRRLVEMLDWAEAAQSMQIPRALEDLLASLEEETQIAQVRDLPVYLRIAELVRLEVQRVAGGALMTPQVTAKIVLAQSAAVLETNLGLAFCRAGYGFPTTEYLAEGRFEASAQGGGNMRGRGATRLEALRQLAMMLDVQETT